MTPSLYSFQKEALSVLEKNISLLLIAPTGSGKSRIFFEWVQRNPGKKYLIVSPLVALNRQHEHAALAAHVPVRQDPKDQGCLILSPESLKNRFQKIKDWSPDFIWVDEAHTLWEWGQDFRPAFQKLKELSTWENSLQFWCSATLTAHHIEEWKKMFRGAHQILGRFRFPATIDLQLIEIPLYQRITWVQNELESNPPCPKMIFVGTRALAEKLFGIFKSLNIPCSVYHAGLSREERMIREQEYRNLKPTDPHLIFATTAFGMGMDFPALRECILFEPSFSILSLAQMLGRIGRAGVRGKATVLWALFDFPRKDWLTRRGPRQKKQLDEVRLLLDPHMNSSDTFRQRLEKHFDPDPISR